MPVAPRNSQTPVRRPSHLSGAWSKAMCRAFLALQPAWSRCRARCLPDLIPGLGVDSRETVQMRQVLRRDGDGIPMRAGERRLAGKDGIGIESVGRRRGDAQASEGSPELEAALIARAPPARFAIGRGLGYTVMSPGRRSDLRNAGCGLPGNSSQGKLV